MNLFSSLSKKQLQGKTVLVRVDLNVSDADMSDSLRVSRAIETIQSIRALGARVVILSHRGRPQNVERNRHNTKLHGKNTALSFRPFVKIFEKALKEKVIFIPSIVQGASMIKNSDGKIFLCENTRFWKGEERNSITFAKQIAHMGDLYVNDAFAVSHRAHASVHAVTRYIPAYAGPQLEQEILTLRRVIKNPRRPLVAVLGGAKVSDKISLLQWFVRRADVILTGGGIANTFMAWCGYYVGDSLRGTVDHIRPFVLNTTFHIPTDTIVYHNKILDIGPKTARAYADCIKHAHIVVWNGPVGNTDMTRFQKGSRAIWRAIRTRARADKGFFAIIGGGETTAFVLKETKKIPSNVFLSTGGGAMLTFLSGKKLPGIEALEYNTNHTN